MCLNLHAKGRPLAARSVACVTGLTTRTYSLYTHAKARPLTLVSF